MHYDSQTLDDYLHGELAPELDAAVLAHLDTCPDCRTVYDGEAALRDWIRAAARAGEREVPSLVKARVWEALRDAEPSLAERLRRLWRPLLVPAAGVLALALYLVLPTFHATAPASVAASYYLREHAVVTAGNPLADRSSITVATLSERTQIPIVEAVDSSTRAGDP